MSLALLALASATLSFPGSACRAVTATEAEGGSQRVISARTVQNLELGTWFRTTVTGDHLMEFKLYTPTGHLYQVLTVPFTVAARRPLSAVRKVDGYPRPLEVQTLAPDRLSRVTSLLPVAGTWITTNSLYGRWRVDAHLDRSVTPCTSHRFTIRP
jgi:hypothetical protein